MKKFLAIFCACLMTWTLTACQPPETTEQIGETKQVKLYLPDTSGEFVEPVPYEMALGTAKEEVLLLDSLASYGAIPTDISVLHFENQDGALTLDLSATFLDALTASGSAGETLLMASVVDTFLSYFGASSLTLTVEGETIETGHAIYDEPFTQVFSVAMTS